jgi:hypothetical protein
MVVVEGGGGDCCVVVEGGGDGCVVVEGGGDGKSKTNESYTVKNVPVVCDGKIVISHSQN